MIPLKFSNKSGFPCIENASASLTTTAETFVFNRYAFLSPNFYGGMFIKITGTATAPSTAVPIQFSTNGVSDSAVNVYDALGTALTTATWPGDGIYLGFYDKTSNTLQLLNI